MHLWAIYQGLFLSFGLGFVSIVKDSYKTWILPLRLWGLRILVPAPWLNFTCCALPMLVKFLTRGLDKKDKKAHNWRMYWKIRRLQNILTISFADNEDSFVSWPPFDPQEWETDGVSPCFLNDGKNEGKVGRTAANLGSKRVGRCWLMEWDVYVRR